MTPIHEDDVVLAFRQSLEEELNHLQSEGSLAEPVLLDGVSAEENLHRLAQSHTKLQSEVALLRTIILKLISEPVDASSQGPQS